MGRKQSKYFWRNFFQLSAAFLVLAILVLALYIRILIRQDYEKARINCEHDAKRVATQIDERLYRIRLQLGNIAGMNWIKKIAAPSDVFLQNFMVIERIESQQELARVISLDDAITEVAIYLPEKDKILSQRGWYSVAEYRSSIQVVGGLDEEEVDEILAAADQFQTFDTFSSLPFNVRETGEEIIMIQSLIHVPSPPASVILVWNKKNFTESIRGSLREDLESIELLNMAGEVLWQEGREDGDVRKNGDGKGYVVEIPSTETLVSYRMVYPELSAQIEGFGLYQIPFWLSLFVLCILLGILAYLLTRLGILPLNRLIEKMSELTEDEDLDSLEDLERIEQTFLALHQQSRDYQEKLEKNYHFAQQYALMLTLLGDEKIMVKNAVVSGLSLTEDLEYLVWIIRWQGSFAGGFGLKEWLQDTFAGQFAILEVLDIFEHRRVVIFGCQGESDIPRRQEQAAEELARLLLEKYHIRIEVMFGRQLPGIGGLSQSYLEMNGKKTEAGEKVPEPRELEQKLVQYVTENYCDPEMSLKKLSMHFGLSVSAISNLFKAASGRSFSEYLTSMRLARARELFRELGYQPGKISEMVGYASEYSFRRAFQRDAGVHLREWCESNDIKGMTK